MRLTSIAATVAAAPFLMAAAAPQHLQPSSQWVVDYAENSCRVIRLFGDNGNQVKLVLESMAPGQLTMVAVGRPITAPMFVENIQTRFSPVQTKPFFGTSARAENNLGALFWTLVPFSNDFKYDGRQFSSKDKKDKTDSTPPQPPTPDEIAAAAAADRAFLENVNALEFSIPRGSQIALDTGPLLDVMNKLNDCDRDLMRSIGLDPDIQDKISRSAQPLNRDTWYTKIVYPSAGLRREEEPTVTFRLLLDADGKPTKCDPFSRYNAPDFDKMVCESMMKVARFSPAELADGTKVPAVYVENVTFRVAQF